ncbi:hypothetical protein J4E90_008978 [Alternaria incomplexa]|uniref:uncharacterized protein n=1 Tax=Alternaria incomplexa TaxID=1187928 RepID=UPI0022207DDE|nr:uncharacterized protein J4E90_008978 [Alternaria incomplexa]KAI4908353.1 hypothetical protein J4E90_008978 [Alternaria incomplexa]
MSSATQQLTHIRKVALIGGTGQVGSHILTHLLGTGKHQVTALTRHTSTATLPTNPNLTVVKVDYDDDTALTSALDGHEFLIITLSARAPLNLHSHIVSCAAAAKIPWIMPNYFGYGIGDRALSGKADLPANFERFIDDVKSTPGLDYTALERDDVWGWDEEG